MAGARMPKKLHKALSALSVRNAGPGRHADGNGLYLIVKPSGARSWLIRYRFAGSSHDFGLGSAGPGGVSLAEARKRAAELQVQIRAGVDPLTERRRKVAEAHERAAADLQSASTFRAMADDFLKNHEASWRNAKHRRQWRRTLEAYAFPVIGDLPIDAIKTENDLAVIEPLWGERPETASRVRGRIEAVLNAATAGGRRTGDNPARWRGHLEYSLPRRPRLTRGHHKAVPYAAVPAFMERLRAREGVAALALEFAILCAARSGETLGATWAEIDLAAGVWTVPAARMKAGREHRTPLSPRAVEIVQTLQPLGSIYVFPAPRGGPLSSMAMAMVLRRMNVDATVHGFRSSFRDWAAETTAYPHEVCEMALAHAIQNKAEAAYRRGDLFDKRRRLMHDWSLYCASGGAVDEAAATPIRGRK